MTMIPLMLFCILLLAPVGMTMIYPRIYIYQTRALFDNSQSVLQLWTGKGGSHMEWKLFHISMPLSFQ